MFSFPRKWESKGRYHSGGMGAIEVHRRGGGLSITQTRLAIHPWTCSMRIPLGRVVEWRHYGDAQ